MEKVAFPALDSFLEKQFSRTLQHWSGGRGPSGRSDSGSKPRYELPVIRTKLIKADFDKLTDEFIFETNTLVSVGGSNEPHKLWYWLDGGTKTIRQPRTAKFPVREPLNRTAPNMLDVNPFGYMTGEWRTILAGERRVGILGRNWTKLVAEEIQNALKAKTIKELSDFTLRDTKIIHPF